MTDLISGTKAQVFWRALFLLKLDPKDYLSIQSPSTSEMEAEEYYLIILPGSMELPAPECHKAVCASFASVTWS